MSREPSYDGLLVEIPSVDSPASMILRDLTIDHSFSSFVVELRDKGVQAERGLLDLPWTDQAPAFPDGSGRAGVAGMADLFIRAHAAYPDSSSLAPWRDLELESCFRITHGGGLSRLHVELGSERERDWRSQVSVGLSYTSLPAIARLLREFFQDGLRQ